MKIKLPILILLFVTVSGVLAQINDPQIVVEHKIPRHLINYSQWDSPNSPKHKFDVQNYQINLDLRNCFLSPYSKAYSGYVIVKFVIDTALNQITLNAANLSIQVTGVSMSGVSFTQVSDILTINLDRTYNIGETVFVKINYNHLNVTDNAFYASGGMIFTDCEPQNARYWLPCWDDPSDKATTDITVKGPAAARIGSNGKLNDSTVTGDTIYYHWISRDPVATYLITIIGKIGFNDDMMYWHRPSNPNDSIPMRFYYNTGDNPTPVKNVIIDMTNYYSSLFGEYPFEKIGMCSIPSSISPWCGGMENQTLINYFCVANWSVSLTSHEFAHQWFGDMITCGTWGDIWLNESFATYCEALWIEHTSGHVAYHSRIVSDAQYYLAHNYGYPIYNPPENEWFDQALTYDKGACVLHMLRYTMGDSLFFAALKAYAGDTANFKYKASVTDDFTTKISQVYGQDLGWFINEWVKQANHPTYQNTFQITNSGSNWSIGFQANQTQSNSPFHTMPLVLDISFTSGPDTVVTVMNNVNNQVWWWNFNRAPNNLQFDPNNDIVLKVASTTQGQINGIQNLHEQPFAFALRQNYPNPFNPTTVIGYDIPEKANVTLKVYNVIGELLNVFNKGEQYPGTYKIDFDGKNLASGIYYYEIRAEGTKSTYTDTKKMMLIK